MVKSEGSWSTNNKPTWVIRISTKIIVNSELTCNHKYDIQKSRIEKKTNLELFSKVRQ